MSHLNMEQVVEPRIYSVSEITRDIRKTLEGTPEFNQIWVKGEVFNLTYHSSGHIYFTLKDDNAVISAVFFKYANKKLSFKLEEGMSVIAFGSITVFEKRGSYQINVLLVKPDGIGELQKRIEQLKAKLSEEGIFDPDRKRELPLLPRRLGVVTSPTGAAIRDIIKVALRRFGNLEIIIAPANVQGEDAPVSIARAVEEINRKEWGVDVIIAGRGGGSFEDLMPFNDEAVVRAFYNSRVPIISAVGHQIDHPLSDDAADAAAPTPSAAAEMAVPVKKELSDEIVYLYLRISNSLQSLFRDRKTRLSGVASRRVFRDPMVLVSNRELVLADQESRMLMVMKDRIHRSRNYVRDIPDLKLQVKDMMKNRRHRFSMALGALEKLSPVSILKRGYSMTLDSSGKIVKSVEDTAPGEMISVRQVNGTLDCEVISARKEDFIGKKISEG